MAAGFTEAARRLSMHCAGGSGAPAEADFRTVRDTLEAFLLSRLGALGNDEILDVADETLAELATQSLERGALEHAGAWLFTVARNGAIDRLRRTREGGTPVDSGSDDDALAELLDRDASAAMVREGMRCAVAAGDHACVRVVAEWLDYAEQLLDAPTSRELGSRMGYSHTMINAHLARFREHLRS